MDRHLMQDRGCTHDSSARQKLGGIGRLLRSIALILFSIFGPSIAMAQLSLRVAQPTRDQQVTIRVSFPVSGTATGTGGAEPHSIDTVTVQVDNEPPLEANLEPQRIPNTFPTVAFSATVQVTECGQHQVTVKATDDIGRSTTQTVPITANAVSPGGCPTITGTIDTRMGNPSQSNVLDLFSGQQVFLYPPIPGGFPVQIIATNVSGLSRVQLYDCVDCPTPILLKEVDRAPSNQPSTLTLAYTFSLQNGEQHKLAIVAEDLFGNRSRKGPVLVSAIAVPSDVFPGAMCADGVAELCMPDRRVVGMVTLTGTLTATPGAGINGADPDYHYFFIPDSEFADVANTLGSDKVAACEIGVRAPGGEVHPEQDGWVVDFGKANHSPPLGTGPLGNPKWWDTIARRYGNSGLIPAPRGWTAPFWEQAGDVVFAWDPMRDVWGNNLVGCYTASDADCQGQRSGDHIRISGRLLYDHEDHVKPCWDTGSTVGAYETKSAHQGHSQGHAEIHPINFIEKIPPLDPSAQTIVWQSACAIETLWVVSKIVDADLRPMAPQPNGSSINLQEIIEGEFTNWTTIAHHTLTLAPDGKTVRLHVEVKSKPFWGGYGKFRAKYILQWLPSSQAHVVSGCPTCPP